MAVRALYCLLVVALMVALRPSATVAQSERSVRWERLGSMGSGAVQTLAVDADSPQRLVAAWQPEVGSSARRFARSDDGGRTWQPLPEQAFTPRTLYRSGSTLFAASDQDGLFASHDGGQSWVETLASERAQFSFLAITLSPRFSHDGLGFATRDGLIWQTRDGGHTWEPVDPADGQLVQAVQFAPDGTLYLAATSSRFRRTFEPVSGESPPPDHATSLGVLRSTDGGLSWQPASDGLEVDGEPFRAVQSITTGPNGTLFAFARGPYAETSLYYVVRAALFRSLDAGASWHLVRDAGANLTWSARLAVRADGVGMLALGSGGLTPASGTCSGYRTLDGGATWSRVIRPGSYEGCIGIAALDPVLALAKGGGYNWLRSLDDGETWLPLQPPGRRASALVAVDRSLVVGADDGSVWAYGLHPPCTHTAVMGFGRVWQSSPEIREALGCPLGPEQPTTVHESHGLRMLGAREVPARDYWTDDLPTWLRIWEGGSVSRLPWTSNQVRPEHADRDIAGAVQQFEGGRMLWVQHPDGSASILVDSPSLSREVPDLPAAEGRP